MPSVPAIIRTSFRKSHGKVTMVLYCRPFSCGGNCLYCFSVDGITKSTRENQDTLLGKGCDWDPVCQLSTRMQWYDLRLGSGAKYDIAVKGDSFANKDPGYLEDFLKRIYDYYNSTQSSNLEEAKARHVNALDRCVTIKAETRPDQITRETCAMMLKLGVTTVELGVQTLDDRILEINRRGHDVETVRRATEMLVNHGFEIGYQIMVGMVGSTPQHDYQMLTEKLWEEGFQPDVLKIYPCILFDNFPQQNALKEKLINGEWKPLSDEDYIELLKSGLPLVPRYVHINRIQRMTDEKQKIAAGCSQVIDRTVFNGISKCLWQRSPAQTGLDLEGDFREFRLEFTPQGKDGYCVEAIVGKEDLLGYGRMTLAKDRTAVIRDLRVLGNMVPVGIRNHGFRGMQHIGIGKCMLRAMERKAVERGQRVMRTHPAPGARAYFEQRGYRLELTDPSLGWMVKEVA